MAIEINNDNFQSEILDYDGVALVDFWAEWCGPCKMLGPVLEQVKEELGNKIKICKVNVDQNSELAQKYSIMSIPAVKLFKNGELVEELVGLQPKDVIIEKINNHLEN